MHVQGGKIRKRAKDIFSDLKSAKLLISVNPTPFFLNKNTFYENSQPHIWGKIFGKISEDNASRLCILIEMIQHFERNILSP